MGLGLLGRGVGDVRFLAEQGAILTVTDLKTEEELRPSLDQLKTYDISYVFGRHRLEDFKNCDMVLKAAGVPLDSPFVAEARKNNIPVKMSASLFAEFFPGMIVGVTGTRGKSTVAAMIFEILKSAGKKTFLGGNVRGISTLAHLPNTSEEEIAVLELDSWQLQGFGDEKISPHVAVFTTFYPDHLNYYGGSLERYLKDKSYIFRFQKPGDYLIFGSQCAEMVRDKYPDIKSKIIVSDSRNVSFNLKIPGEHNLYNAALAKVATEALGIEEEIIKKSLSGFKGVSGRLELVREIDGVKIFNDTTSTTPTSTVAALKALGSQKKNIVLIIGGNDKGLDLTELLEALVGFCKAVILLPGTGTEKLLAFSCQLLGEDFKNLKDVKVYEVADLQGAMQKAMQLAESKDTILFSPAFTSFGQFKNEFDRGDQFMELISKI